MDFCFGLHRGTWSATVTSLTVNVGATPIIAVAITHLSPGAGWVFKLDDAPYDPAHPREIVTNPAGGNSPGRYLVDLREISRAAWHGRKQIDLRLFVTGPPGGASVTFSQIALSGVKRSGSTQSLARANSAGKAKAHVPKYSLKAEVAATLRALLRAIFNAPDPATAQTLLQAAVVRYKTIAPRLGAWMVEAIAEGSQRKIGVKA